MASKNSRRVFDNTPQFREDLKLLVLLSLKEEKRMGVKPYLRTLHVQYQVYFASLILDIKTDYKFYYYIVWSDTVIDIIHELKERGFVGTLRKTHVKPSFKILKNLDEEINTFPEGKVRSYEKAMASTRLRDIFVSDHKIYVSLTTLYLLKNFPDKNFVTYLKTLWILGWHIEPKFLKVIFNGIPGGKIAGFFPKNKIKSGLDSIKPRKVQHWDF